MISVINTFDVQGLFRIDFDSEIFPELMEAVCSTFRRFQEIEIHEDHIMVLMDISGTTGLEPADPQVGIFTSQVYIENIETVHVLLYDGEEETVFDLSTYGDEFIDQIEESDLEYIVEEDDCRD